MNADVSALGTFDVVLFLGVLYHLEDPLQAVRRVFDVTRELAVIETAAVMIPGYEHVPLCEFYESNELNADVSNWWAPNQRALIGLCRAAGFRRVEPLTVAPSQAVSTRLKSTVKYLVAETGMEMPARRLNTSHTVRLCMPGSRSSQRVWILSTRECRWSSVPEEQLVLFHLDRIGARLHQADDRRLSTYLYDVRGRK